VRKYLSIFLITVLLGGMTFSLSNPVLAEEIKIGVVIKTLSNPHWVTMKQGIEDMAKALGVTVEIGSVPSESDVEAQLNLLETMIEKGYQALYVSPITPTNLLPGLKKATDKGIPIINVDELIPNDIAEKAGVKIRCTVASNNYDAGTIAARYIIEALKGKGKVAVLEGQPGAKSGIDRKNGFIDTIKKEAKGIVVVSSQPANWDRNKAFEVTTNILQAHPDLKAVFACNDTMALGAGEAVKTAGKMGKIIIIGVDGIPDARQAIKDGLMTGTVAQYPYVMGQLGILSAYNVLKGKDWPKSMISPVQLLLKEDLK
jgi:D-allose transport system substrate-binding protein